MIKGQVKWFDTTKGYGFVVPDDGQGDVLLHANVLRNFGRSSVAEGALITIEAQGTDRGRQAVTILEIDTPETAQEEPAAPRPTELVVGDASDQPLLPARVKWFDKTKGFGFVNVFGDGDDVFVHMEVLRLYGLSDLQPGEAVSVRILQGPRGKMAAEVHSWDHAQLADAAPGKTAAN
ncbi:cold-shock protein [Oceanomicrobium pacificus]|uniref:Cold shock domain-containing protein n=1 Tax=Oceanomicrobium pacificus TaxID=2692916 RepID=A0A6B0TTQ9_9RHOB|nr:cold-shock protein [Oceanomicrobium pacificus]MXU66169.1 cold shock domain-containing protein [Oceanomicrobium pacificus]